MPLLQQQQQLPLPIFKQRVPRVSRQVTRVPGKPGRVKNIVQRLPTPIPDTIERIFIEQPGKDIINYIFERPYTPPPKIVDKYVHQMPPKQVTVTAAPPAQVTFAQPQVTTTTTAPAPVPINSAPVTLVPVLQAVQTNVVQQASSMPCGYNYNYNYCYNPYCYTSCCSHRCHHRSHKRKRCCRC